jgi:predicted amidohydrolase YtcJ
VTGWADAQGAVAAGIRTAFHNDALKAPTVHAFWQLRSEDQIGSIEVGKYDDLIIVERGHHTIAADKLISARVLFTYSAGTLVCEREQSDERSRN